MSMNSQPYEPRLDDDLTLLSDTLEEVLRASGDPADQKYIELKARAAMRPTTTISVPKSGLPCR